MGVWDSQRFGASGLPLTPRRISGWLGLFFLLTAIGACSSGSSTDPPDENPTPSIDALDPASVIVGSGALTLTVSGSGFVEASIVRWDGSERTTTYVSASELTASIPAADVASQGDFDVTVFSPPPGGGESASTPFVVSPVAVASVEVTPDEATLVPGQTLQLEATPRADDDTELSDRAVAWTTTDESVAEVDESGLVTAVGPGPATIRATSDGIDGEAAIDVVAGGLVGPGGGEVSSGADVVLTVPAGAVGAPVAISIDPDPNPPAHPRLVTGTAWDLGPDGTTFDAAVTVQLKYDATSLPAGVDEANLVVHRWDGAAWKPLGSPSVDLGAGTASGTTTEFSTFAILEVVFESVANGGNHNCAVVTGGRGYCWGWGDEGALGNGSQADQVDPVPVLGGLAFAAVSPGFDHTCSLTLAGEGYCWGAGDRGQLGTGIFGDRLVPGMVTGGHSFGMISSGFDHTCGLDTAGTGFCWGLNQDGQLGDGSTTDRAAPRAVEGGHLFASIDAGGYHSCALTGEGAAWCWGWNVDGQVGNGNTVQQSEPVAVVGGHDYNSISAGGFHTCALDGDGTAWCWGWGERGQLGNGSFSSGPTSTPVPVEGGHEFTQIAAGSQHTCALKTSGEIYCWGNGGNGALGIGTGDVSNSNVPVKVTGTRTYASVSAGDFHTCARSTEGSVWCWGWGPAVGLGVGADALAPRLISNPALTPGSPAIAGSSPAPRQKERNPRPR